MCVLDFYYLLECTVGKTVNTHVFVDVVVPADFQVMTVKENSTWKCARSTNAIPTPTMYSQALWALVSYTGYTPSDLYTPSQ